MIILSHHQDMHLECPEYLGNNNDNLKTDLIYIDNTYLIALITPRACARGNVIGFVCCRRRRLLAQKSPDLEIP